MKHLFSFLEEKDVYHVLKLIAKVFKVLGIVFACISALVILFNSINYSNAFVMLLGIMLAAISFFLCLFYGLVSETLCLGFASITRNNIQQIKERGMDNDDQQMDVLDKIKKLGTLKNEGIISEEEYQAKKRSLLNEI